MRSRLSGIWRLLAALSLLAAGGTGNLRGDETVTTEAELDPPQVVEVAASDGRGTGRQRVVLGSILGVLDDQRVWTPLPLTTLFSEGWDEPWISPPSGSSGAVRQGWANSADGLFFRNLVWLYQNTQGLPNGLDTKLGLFQFQSPLSRRLWITFDVPFVTTLGVDRAATNVASFGDLNLTPRVMLRESQNLAVIAGLGVRSPTG